jgi:hypothetical protein
MRALVAGLCLLVVLAVPAPAPAATVEVVVAGTCDRDCRYGVAIRAGAGERNQVQVQGDGASVTVRDAGAELRPGERCARDAAGAVTCTPPPFGYQLVALQVRLEDGDDTADTSGYVYGPARIDGGAGDDRLRTGQDPGDTLVGGTGNDMLDGGTAPDTADYAGATADIRADLKAGTVQIGAERDTLRSVAVVVGGSGDDVLVGDAGADGLVGGPGRDRLSGGAGRDHLVGGPGSDRLSGGAGDDQLNVMPGGSIPPPGTRGRDRFGCGAGRDHAYEPDEDGVVSPQCERVSVAGGPEEAVRLRLPLSRPGAAVLETPFSCLGDGNRIWAEVRRASDGLRLGRAAHRCANGKDDARRVRVRLNGSGRQIVAGLGRGRRLRVRVVASESGHRGSFVTELSRGRRAR